ncbi:MAG: hypothetical protein AAGA48_13315 [Myxococcota bacterium]
MPTQSEEVFAPPRTTMVDVREVPRPVSLTASVRELRQRGFDILEETPHEVRATRRRLHPDLLTSICVVVWLRQVDHVDADCIEADSSALQTWAQSNVFRSSLPTRLTILGYLAESSTPSARALVARGPRMGFGRFRTVGIHDADGVHVFRGRRAFGLAFYPIVNFLQLTLLAPQPRPEPRVGWLWLLILAIGAMPLLLTALLIGRSLARAWGVW